jgi:ABC-type transporter Mla subunit MlaD
MTVDELARLIQQYRAGLDAEMNLLRQLALVSEQQHADTHDRDFAGFHHAADERDRLMQSLVTIEAGLRDVRQHLADNREQASRLPGFEDVIVLHREAAQLVSTILSTDKQSLSSLADAELARRSAVAGIERGETTLAAYRRVLTPPVASATLVDRRG